MKRKKAPGRDGKVRSTRRLVALSAAAATVWTVSQTVNWQAVSQSLSGLRQGSELVEEIVRQELIRPAEEGGQAGTVGLGAAGGRGIASADEQQSGDQRLSGGRRDGAAVCTGPDGGRGEGGRRAGGRGRREASGRGTEGEGGVRGGRKGAEKKESEAVSIDTSKIKASAIRVDNHTQGISVKAADYFEKKVTAETQARQGRASDSHHAHPYH